MIKSERLEIINDIKSKRDAVALSHQQLKENSDNWNKCIIILSLVTGGLESIKMKLKLDGAGWSLVPILLSSVIAACSALIKFKDFNRKMEILIEANSRLTNILTKARNHSLIDDDLIHEYNDGLECIETSMYPNERKVFLKQSHKNLIEIMKQEQKYYGMIDRVNNGEPIILSDSSSSSGSEDNVLKRDVLDVTEHGVTSVPKNLQPISEEEVDAVINNL
tara:strand:- start:343 stop:1005 length:663 start_codon:yes stop_codon:yes gene_type:complete